MTEEEAATERLLEKFVFRQEKLDISDDDLDHICGLFNKKWFERGMQYL